MLRGSRHVVLLVVLAVLTAACDKAQLLAPTKSTITLSAPTRVLPSNGSAPVTATVIEQAGTPVQNGTTVRFTTTLGRVEPVEVQTVNGLAITTFFAGPNSGIAEIRGNSGAATGGTSTGTGGTTTTTEGNMIRISIGAAAVNTISVRANPGTIGPNGGSVELIASVVGENGQALEGILVTFNTDQGSLSSATATTNANGEARTTLTASQRANVTATAGTKTSTPATVIDVRAGPIVTVTCAPTVGTATNCAAVGATTSANTATVTFTITRPTGSSALRAVTIDFGDGTTQSLGNLAGGTATVTHTYSGPSDSSPRNYTATVIATDINGETATSSVAVVITPRNTTPIAVSLSATCPSTERTQLTARCSFEATVTGGGEGGTGNAAIQSYSWDFGDGTSATTSGNRTSHVYTRDSAADPQVERQTVTVTARTADGRTGSAQEEIVVQYNAGLP